MCDRFSVLVTQDGRIHHLEDILHSHEAIRYCCGLVLVPVNAYEISREHGSWCIHRDNLEYSEQPDIHARLTAFMDARFPTEDAWTFPVVSGHVIRRILRLYAETYGGLPCLDEVAERSPQICLYLLQTHANTLDVETLLYYYSYTTGGAHWSRAYWALFTNMHSQAWLPDRSWLSYIPCPLPQHASCETPDVQRVRRRFLRALTDKEFLGVYERFREPSWLSETVCRDIEREKGRRYV